MPPSSTDLPPGVLLSAHAGWVVDPGDQIEPVPQASNGLPKFFTAIVSTEKAPAVVLQFRDLDDGVQLVTITSLGPDDADKAMRRLAELRPLAWWKTNALIRLAVGPLPTDAELTQERQQQIADAAVTPRKRTRLEVTDELLQEVATVYREALVKRQRPTKAVAERFGKSSTAAARLVRLAREARFLGRSIDKKAGEVPWDD